MNKAGKTNNTVPLGVWPKTLLLLGIIFSITFAYDRYYRYNNRIFEYNVARIADFERTQGKPLVVGIGASSMMRATFRNWQVEDFDWLRIIIQGSRIEDHVAIAEWIIELKPDLVLLGLHQFAYNPRSQQLRAAFKRMMRAPLEELGWIRRIPLGFERKDCDGSVMNLSEAVQYVQKQLESPDNELASATLLAALKENDIPVRIFRVPMLDTIENTATNRITWIENFRRDAKGSDVEILETGWRLEKEYFCGDLLHLNDNGQETVTAWLAPEIVKILDSTE